MTKRLELNASAHTPSVRMWLAHQSSSRALSDKLASSSTKTQKNHPKTQPDPLITSANILNNYSLTQSSLANHAEPITDKRLCYCRESAMHRGSQSGWGSGIGSESVSESDPDSDPTPTLTLTSTRTRFRSYDSRTWIRMHVGTFCGIAERLVTGCASASALG